MNRFNWKVTLGVSLIAMAFGASCGSNHADVGAGNQGPAPIQKTYGIRAQHEIQAYLAAITNLKVNTAGGNLETTWNTKRVALSNGATVNAKNAQAYFDIAWRIGESLTNTANAMRAKWFPNVLFSGAGSTLAQFNDVKKAAVAEAMLTRLSGKKPTAEEIAAAVTTLTELIAVDPANSTTNVMRIYFATVAASTLGGLGR